MKRDDKDVLAMGFHKGKTIKEVFKIDRNYIYWIARKHPILFSEDIKRQCIELAIKNHVAYRPLDYDIDFDEVIFEEINYPVFVETAVKYKFRFDLIDQDGNLYKGYSEDCPCFENDNPDRFIEIFIKTPIPHERGSYLTHIVEIKPQE